MYAHQVIEDLEKLSIDTVAPRFINHMLKSIKKSVSFHLDNPDNLLQMRDSERETLIWERFPLDHYRTPFPFCWFDWEMDGNKHGALVEENELDLCIWAFCYMSRYGSWVPGAIATGVRKDTGKPFSAGVQEIFLSLSEHDKDMMYYLASLTGTVIETALLLINCKNVITEIIKTPEALNKKRRRNGRQEIFDYRVLNLVLPNGRREYSEKGETFSHNRIHLCRGHFKEYTKEHPLFGKLTGLYWWQPHVRGQNKEGVVIKDYNVSL